jgi:hypothetical protein
LIPNILHGIIWIRLQSIGGGFKTSTYYEDLHNSLLAHVITALENTHTEACEPKHVHAANTKQAQILDARYAKADLREIVDSISTINLQEKENYFQFLKKYEHHVDTTDVNLDLKINVNSYHDKAFPVPKMYHNTLKKEIERLVQLGFLKWFSYSEWAAPMIIIPKKNGTLRFTSNFRKINVQLRRKSYPITDVTRVRTSLNLNMGYYAIRLDPDAQKCWKVSILETSHRHFMFTWYLSGKDVLSMHQFKFVRTYVDDLVVINGSTFKDHIQKLDVVLKVLSQK